jgi:hypothetical protein
MRASGSRSSARAVNVMAIATPSPSLIQCDQRGTLQRIATAKLATSPASRGGPHPMTQRSHSRPNSSASARKPRIATLAGAAANTAGNPGAASRASAPHKIGINSPLTGTRTTLLSRKNGLAQPKCARTMGQAAACAANMVAPPRAIVRSERLPVRPGAAPAANPIKLRETR